jgi:hypothetical protein
MAFFWGEDKPPPRPGRRSGTQPRSGGDGGTSGVFGATAAPAYTDRQELQQEAELREELWRMQQQRQQQQQQQPQGYSQPQQQQWKQPPQQQSSFMQSSGRGVGGPGGGGGGASARRPSPYRDEASASMALHDHMFNPPTNARGGGSSSGSSAPFLQGVGAVAAATGAGSAAAARNPFLGAPAPSLGMDAEFDARVAAMHERRRQLNEALWMQFGGEGEPASRGVLPAFDKACDRAFEKLRKELEQRASANAAAASSSASAASADFGGGVDYGFGGNASSAAASALPRTPFDADVQREMAKIMDGLQQQLRAEDGASASANSFRDQHRQQSQQYRQQPSQYSQRHAAPAQQQSPLQQYQQRQQQQQYQQPPQQYEYPQQYHEQPKPLQPSSAFSRRHPNVSHNSAPQTGYSPSPNFFGGGESVGQEGGYDYGGRRGDNKKAPPPQQQQFQQQNEMPMSSRSRGRYSARGNSTFTFG